MTDKKAHSEHMKEVKSEVDKKIKEASLDKGLIIVLTGDGKGKSSSGFGMIARALGHGMKAGIVQYIKGKIKTGEDAFFSKQEGVSFHAMGEGFTWNVQDRDKDVAAVRRGWEKSLELLKDSSIDVVMLDELNVVLEFDYLPVEEVVSALKNKLPNQHIIITGRGAKQEIIDLADTVSEVSVVKHAFESGIRAQRGIEF